MPGTDPEYGTLTFQTLAGGGIRLVNDALPETVVVGAELWAGFLAGESDYVSVEQIPTPPRLKGDEEWYTPPPTVRVTITAVNATFTYQHVADTPDGDKLCTLQAASEITAD